MEKLSWTALEYEEKERSKDWFWALGIIVVTGSTASIIYNNYFFAVLLLISGVMLGFFATKKPEEISYELNDKGFKILDKVYPYENIKSFWLQIANEANGNKTKLFIKLDRAFMPMISVSAKNEVLEHIHTIMSKKNIEEVEMQEHISEKIMESLGF